MNDYWKSLSERERKLVLLTSGLSLVFMCAWIVVQAVTTFSDLNSDVVRLEKELENLTHQQALGAGVQSAFKQVEAAHSSDWTEQQISDRLRREIYRLALKKPYSPDQSVATASASSDSAYMVRIPVLRAGTLTEFEDGYREYQVPIQIPKTKLRDLLVFIERLQKSPQMLRVDSLQISRPPKGTIIKVSMDVTRTVVNTSAEAAAPRPRPSTPVNLAENPGLEEWDDELNQFLGWQTPECTVSRSSIYATEGEWSMSARAANDSGNVFQIHTLQSGKPYRLVVDIAATSPATLSVVLGDRSQVGEAIALEPSDQPKRVEIRFVPPGDPGATQKMLLPFIAFGEGGGDVSIDNVQLMEAGA